MIIDDERAALSTKRCVNTYGISKGLYIEHMDEFE